MQLVDVSRLRDALRQYMDPDGGIFDEEIGVYHDLIMGELGKVIPQPAQVLFWDDQEGSDPPLDLSADLYDRRELLGDAEGGNLIWNKSGGSYYGATLLQRKWYPVGQFVISLWFGGSPLNSAPGFYVIPV